MKKVFLLVAISLISISTFSQKPDTTKSHKDTVFVPVYLITDTLPARYLFRKGRAVKYGEGFIIVKGAKSQKGEWLQQPNIIQALDRKRKTVANVIQYL